MGNLYKKLLKLIFKKQTLNSLPFLKALIYDSHATMSYSQEGEDMLLRRFFGDKSDGFYVDVGAYHPKRFSNTYHFYKRAWYGINIDARPGSMKLFKLFRKRDINLEEAVSDQPATLNYYMFDEPALNGFSQEVSELRKNEGDYELLKKVEIQTKRLDEILDQHLPRNQEVSFLSIDVESLDLQVLKSNNWEKYRPAIILVELLDESLENLADDQVYLYLKEHDYFFVAKTLNTCFFAEKNFYSTLYKG